MVAILAGAAGCIEWDSLSDDFNPEARLLFSSGFEPATEIEDPGDVLAENITPGLFGDDHSTGQSWDGSKLPPELANGGRGFTLLHVLSSTGTPPPGNAKDYIRNVLSPVAGPGGDATVALEMSILKPSPNVAIQDDFSLPTIEAPIDDIYVRMWMRFGPELADQVAADQSYFRTVWKIDGVLGDIDAKIERSSSATPRPVWQVAVGSTLVERLAVDVPVDRWFAIELYFKRGDGMTGRLVFAVDGEVVADHRGATDGIGAIRNFKFASLHGSNPSTPWGQWVDDFEIWSQATCKTLPCQRPR